MSWLRGNRKFLVVVVVIVLVTFLALHDFYNIGVSNHLQETINYMSAEGFQSWLDEMKSVKSILETARTNLDVKEAMNYTFAAQGFANILDWTIEVLPRPPDFVGHLYGHIAMASILLNHAVSAIATKPPTTLQYLNDDTLQKTGNLTTTIENLVNLATITRARYDIGPIQQLKEKDVLDNVINYVKQIATTSGEIWEIYDYYG